MSSLSIKKNFTPQQQQIPLLPKSTIAKQEIVTRKGVRISVTTEIKKHSCLWQVGRLILAFAATFFTLGFGLYFKPIQDFWKQGFSGEEKVEVQTRLDGPPKKVRRAAESVLPKKEVNVIPRSVSDSGKITEPVLPKKEVNVIPRKFPESGTITTPAPEVPRRNASSVREPKKAKIELTVRSPLLRADKIEGLQYRFHKKFIHVADAKRFQIRDATLQAVRQQHSGNGQYGMLPPVLYKSKDSVNTYTRNTQLLGGFDVVQVGARMDYDHCWDKWQGKRERFFVHHGAAINIGESNKAEDFSRYSNGRSLNVGLYLKDTGQLFYNMLKTQTASGAKHAVWFPFGMGAFLRHLEKNDPSYRDQEKLFSLKKGIAEAFVNAASKFPQMQIHLCLPAVLNKGSEDETNKNYNAFIAAIANGDDRIKKQIKVYVNEDATTLAQTLANENGPGSVSLANGANRNLIGNHWFKNGALRAIDENAHRRSFELALAAKLLNGGFETKARDQGSRNQFSELERRVAGLGGKIIPLD